MSEKKEAGGKRNRAIGVFAILICLILLSVLCFLAAYRELNQNIQQERRDYVSEISQQLTSNISLVRSDNIQLSTLLADILSHVQPDNFEVCDTLFRNYGEDDRNSIFFVTDEGTILSITGEVEQVDNRDYVRQVLEKEYYSAFEKIGREEEYWLFSTRLSQPCQISDQKIQAVILAWEKEAYSENMTISIFDGLGYSFLVKSNGAISVSPEMSDQTRVGFNILSTLKEWGIEELAFQKVESDLKRGENNSLVCKLDGLQWLLQYNQLEEGSFTFIMLPLALTAAGTYQGLTATMLSALSVLVSLSVLVIYIINVNARREKERQQEMYEITLAKKAVEAKNDFLAKMSHDIRTPLNGIIGMNYIAASQIGPGNPEALESLKKMEVSSQYLLNIINDILDMSKIESGKLMISARAFSLAEVLENIRNMLEITAEEKQVAFETAFQISCEYGYLGDPLRINQILMNLLSNAFKFTEAGSVRLEVAAQRLDDTRDQVTMKVADTGKGMSPEYLEKICTPFLQEDSEIAERYGGSGLGLSIVKSLVDLMGGTLSVKSEKGKGTEFTVILPLERTRIEEGKTTSQEARSGEVSLKGKRVLIAEDNDLNAEITMEILKMEGLKVEWVQNGKAALELFESSNAGDYSMILMDVHMPVMDGLTAAKAIRNSNHPDGATIPICALSANAFADDVEKSRMAGMNDHLKKPLELDKLSAALRRYIR